MNWLLTLIVLAIAAYFLIRALRGRAPSGAAGHDALDHDGHGHGDGANRPLPGQHAASGGAEVQDATHGQVGAHLESETPAGGRPDAGGGVGPEMAARAAGTGDAAAGEVGAAARGQAPATGATPESTATLAAEGGDGGARTAPLEGTADDGTVAYGERDRAGDVTAGGAAAAATSAPRPDPESAARAAEERADTGGTGGAVLAGIAAAGAAEAAAATGTTHEGRDGRDATADAAAEAPAASRADAAAAATNGTTATTERERELVEQGTPPRPAATDEALANPPDAETAGALDPGRAEHEPTRARATDDPATHAGAPAPASDAETASGQSPRDNARTNAPVGDTATAEAARDPVDAAAAAAPRADETPAAAAEPEARANAPDAATAGGPLFRDRSVDARSNVAAGTATLVVGGATSSAGPARRIDAGGGGDASGKASAAPENDRVRLERIERRERVREMMKILNLRDGDASRLAISKEDFVRLRRGDGDVADTLVDEVDARLRRMLA